ncbi:Uncharacterised protein [Legionella beliardensis]|uniref:Uncharacterized protein n=1 Tax=Legionella beliardensis TaxID=91822 RepID=A0A378HYL5_9GAMM|nr:hypothetical protein [Legionella beliardensis]STX27998.1 Uncharacterised protein [Legionella beliardensis]
MKVNNLVINNAEAASSIWMEFTDRYKACLPPSELSNKKGTEYIPEPSDKEAAMSPVLIPSENYSPEVRHLVNNREVKMSRNLQRLKLLEEALETRNWDADILKNEGYIYEAMTLFNSGKISQQQMYTLLDRYQLIHDKASNYQISQTYDILNEEGSFTEQAEKTLLPAISKFINTDEHKESFRLLIKTLPASEQIFYTSSTGKNVPSSKEFFSSILLEADVLYLTKNNEFLFLSAGAYDAANIAAYGVNEYIRFMRKLGELNVGDIEEGIKFHARYGATSYPGSPSYKVHGNETTTAMEATEHDKFHSSIMSRVPNNILYAFEHMKTIARTSLNMRWSKEIWEWTDLPIELFIYMERLKLVQPLIDRFNKKNDGVKNKEDIVDFSEENKSEIDALGPVISPYFGSLYYMSLNYPDDLRKTFSKPSNELTDKELTEIFCHIITFGFNYAKDNMKGSYLFTYINNITLLGAIVLLDMFFNADKWKEFHIDPQYLLGKSLEENSSPLKYCLDLIKEIEPIIRDDDPKIKALTTYLFLKLACKDNKNIEKHLSQIKELHDLMLANQDTLKNFTFSKISKSSKENNNLVILTFNKENCLHWNINKFKEMISKLNTSNARQLPSLNTLGLREGSFFKNGNVINSNSEKSSSNFTERDRNKINFEGNNQSLRTHLSSSTGSPSANGMFAPLETLSSLLDKHINSNYGSHLAEKKKLNTITNHLKKLDLSQGEHMEEFEQCYRKAYDHLKTLIVTRSKTSNKVNEFEVTKDILSLFFSVLENTDRNHELMRERSNIKTLTYYDIEKVQQPSFTS